MKKLFTLLMLLVAIVTGASATEYELIDHSTKTLTGNFICNPADPTADDQTFEGKSFTCYVKTTGNMSSWGNKAAETYTIDYDIKTDDVTFTIWVGQTNQNTAFDIYYAIFDENSTAAHSAPDVAQTVLVDDLAKNTYVKRSVRIQRKKNSRICFYTAKSDAKIYQIIADETGTALPIAGEAGYSLNMNKGRFALNGSKNGKIDNNIEIIGAKSSYNMANSSNVQISANAVATSYVKFTTPATPGDLQLTWSGGQMALNTSASADNATSVTSSESVSLSGNTTYYLVNTSTSAQSNLTMLMFVTPAAPAVPTLTGAWKIGEDDVTGETADVVQGATAPSIPTFTVGATSGTPTSSDYQVAYEETGDEGIFTYTDGVPTGISTANAGSATITATLTTKDDTKYLTPETNTFTYTVTVSEAQAPTKPSITGVPEAAVAKNASVTLTASSTGAPTPTYQWYTCDSEGGNQAEITGADEASYSPATTSLGTTYYIVKASNSVQSGVASDVVAIQVVGSSECKLTEAKYSNGFNAFINESAKTVKAYYLAGTSAPTISSTQISTGATVDTSNPSSIVVTAEDGTTTATYAVEVSSVEPYSGIGCTFDGSESWIKTGGAYVTENNNKVYYAWVINKNSTADDRIPLGKTRIYFFVDDATSITLINDRGTALSYNRAIKVYVNGELQDAPTTMPKKDSDNPAPQITIATGSAAMVEIASNQGDGDTGWGKIVVNGTSMNLPLNDGGSSFTKGFTTFCSPANFTVSEGATAYKASIADSKLTMTALEGIIPANTGVVIAGSKNTNATIATTTAAATADVTDNDLKGTTAEALTADLKGTTAAKFLAFKKSTSTFTPYGGTNFPANKAYLLLDSNNNSQSLEMVFEEATGINNVNAAETEAQAAPVKVIKNGKLFIGNYNVAGQQVK